MPSDSPVTRVEIEQSVEDNLWYMRAKADNGEVVWDAEGHANYGDALSIAARTFPSVPMVKIETVGGTQVKEDVSVAAAREATAKSEGAYRPSGATEGS